MERNVKEDIRVQQMPNETQDSGERATTMGSRPRTVVKRSWEKLRDGPPQIYEVYAERKKFLLIPDKNRGGPVDGRDISAKLQEGVRDTFKQNIPKLPAGLGTRACPLDLGPSNLVEWRWNDNIWSQSSITTTNAPWNFIM